MRDSKVLLCHRSASRSWYPNVWDFPGGHVEEGETDTIALKRELREELAIELLETQDLPVARLTFSDFAMTIWLVTEWSGSPRNAQSVEHDEIGWFTEEAALGLDLADKTCHSLIAKVFSQRAAPSQYPKDITLALYMDDRHRFVGHAIAATGWVQAAHLSAHTIVAGAQASRATGCVIILYRRYGLPCATEVELRSFRSIAGACWHHGLVVVDHLVVIAAGDYVSTFHGGP